MYKLINGYIVIKCSNCNKNFNKKQEEFEKKQEYYFCDKSCKSSYKIANPHISIDTYKSENCIMNIVNNIKDNNLKEKIAYSS